MSANDGSEPTTCEPFEYSRRSRRWLLGAGTVLAISPALGGSAFAANPDGAPTRRGYATIDGLRIYYEQYSRPSGTAVPIVLLHGGAMSIGTAFAGDLIPRFARTRPVIAIEQQGHGHTADRASQPTINRMVEDTAGVLDQLAVGQAHFVGHSMGGMIALGMAIRRPDLVRSVTTLSGTYNTDGLLPELVEMQHNPAHKPSAALAPLLPKPADYAAMEASFVRDNPGPANFGQVMSKLNKMLAEWEGWTPAQLRAVRAPVLVVIGDNDFVRIEHAVEMARLIPGAELAILPGTTHMGILTRGAWLTPLIDARIQAVPG